VSRVDLTALSGGTSASGGPNGGAATGGGAASSKGGQQSVGGVPSEQGGTASSTGGRGEAGDDGGDTAGESGGGAPPGAAGAQGDAGNAGDSGQGGRPGTGGSSAGGSSTGGMAGEPSSDRIPAFVAQGDRMRTLVSCDDGQTWVADQGLPYVNCDEEDCDHDEGAPRGIAYGNGWFVAAFGWGSPGSIRRSRDGVDWEVTVEDLIHTEVAFGEGIFMAGGGGEQPLTSPDGDRWTETSESPNPNSRVVEFVNGDLFVVFGETDEMITMTSDLGETWDVPSDRPEQCGPSATGIASGNGVIVGASFRHVCVSEDDGDTWQQVSLPGDRLTSVPVFDGSRFMIWAGATVHLSTDGVNWTQETCTPNNISVNAVAIGANGTFVASQGSEDAQRFYRSEDGITWQRLADDRFPKGQRIKYIEPGEVAPSSACPAP